MLMKSSLRRAPSFMRSPLAAASRSSSTTAASSSSSAHLHAAPSTSPNLTGSNPATLAASVDPEEIRKFGQMAQEWWNPSGPFRLLHLMNPVRVAFLRQCLQASTEDTPLVGLEGYRLLDVGCGGGIFTEALARLGANVVGVDAAEPNIRVATFHAEQQRPALPGPLVYQHTTVEAMAAKEPGSFDVVCAMEVLEHVLNPSDFIQTCAQLVSPGGWLLGSTLNRTPVSYLLAITMAEYVLRLAPQGTHDYQKFIQPDEVRHMLEKAGLEVVALQGLVYNPLLDRWHLMSSDAMYLQCNYIFAARKPLKEI